MTIENAGDAATLVAGRMGLESVLDDIEFFAKKGQRSRLFAWLSADVRGELTERGFTLVGSDSNSGYVEVRW